MKLAMHLIPSILYLTLLTRMPKALAKGIHRKSHGKESFVHPAPTPTALAKANDGKITGKESFVHPG
jgi:hypothetical protein